VRQKTPEEIATLHAQMVPGRSCGSCSMCCKVFDVPWVEEKPKGQWCRHCKPGRGCGIWDTRPQGCRTYYCQWFFAPMLGDEWRPDRAKFLLNLSADDFWVEIVVDPALPHAWKREPYLSFLRRTAGERMARNQGMMLHLMDRRFIVTPTEEVEVTHFPTGTRFELSVAMANGAPQYRINVLQPAA
jgi:hypothetical protein